MLPGLEPAELPADAIEVGRVTDAWGVKGWFKVLPYSADPEALFSSKRWYLLPTEKGVKTFEGVGQLKIKEAKIHSDTVVASAHGVDDRTAADALRGARIFIAKSSFPTPQKDEYYWVDLIGLEVVNREGLVLGQVSELLSTGPQTVLVIQDQLDGQTLQRMIPFVAAYVDDVDLAARRILVDWQPDY
ncbi:ribosome maturation factor RimM [Rhodoferax sp. BLA1]|uniref:ribosome maturation factor RimM n=1 Tax=Rhodoferax sp. BLA1 TaxID=2576062 RepID=UPI0015D42438|nr:ribosome maturation factor RimM [Rhodoferax sp. BLA1]